jgi:hypothetical protein
MKKHILLILTIATANSVLAQIADKRTWSWYFGSAAGIQFTSAGQPPVAITGSAMVANEGSSAISDTSGNILFYTNGQTAWDRNNAVLPNGTGLLGHYWSAQSGLLVPMPGSDSLFCLFTVNNWSDTATQLNYSVIDLSLNGGAGDIISSQKNILVNANCREQLTAVFHANGQDIWILSHEYGANYVAYLLTAQGLTMTPVISAVGDPHEGWNRYGYLKVSPYCNKIASALGGDAFGLPDTTVEVCDFDNATGVVSNAVFLADYNSIPNAYGCEFSPDNTKLYVTNFNGPNIYQFDLTSGIPASTMTDIAPLTNIKSSLTLGPDGKIYVSEQSTGQLGAIDFPNIAGTGCSFTEPEVLLANGLNTIGSCNLFHRCPSTTSIMAINSTQNIFDVFPNPATRQLTVSSSEQLDQINISDVTGRMVYQKQFDGQNILRNVNIDVSGFSIGIYFVHLIADGQVFVKKVVIR